MNSRYPSIYISPHIDDVVFSCGGTLWKQQQKDKCLLIDVFCESRKTTPQRFKEEEAARRFFGYDSHLFKLPDSAARDPLLGELPHRKHRFLKRKDFLWVERVRGLISDFIKNIGYEKIYFPLAVGMHVDHEICFQASLEQFPRTKIFYYEDIPYALLPGLLETRLFFLTGKLLPVSGRRQVMPLEDELKLIREYVLEIPPCSRISSNLLKRLFSIFIYAFFKHRLRQVTQRARSVPFRLISECSEVGDVLEKKAKGMLTYRTQWPYFFDSEESMTRRLKEEGTNRFIERFWRWEV